MSPNKRKLVGENIADETNSFKRRSSLQVNLSCVSNLSDSGNESLRQTALNTTNIDTSSKSNRCSRSREASIHKEDKSYHGIPLKNVSVVLEKINSDDEILNKNCEKLKQAILNKTKQMFDKQNELSIKTRSILGNKYPETQSKMVELDQSIGSTPKDKRENENTKEQKKQIKLKKRRLFNKNNSKHISLESSSLQLRSRSQSRSIILAGSNKISNTSCDESHKNNSAASSAAESESELTAVPIGCSTMINDETCDEEGETDSEVENHQTSLNKHTKKNVVSMDITDMQGGFMRYSDENSRVTSRNSANTVRTSMNVNTSMDALDERNKSKNKDSGSIQEEEMHPVASEEAQESINTVRTSLQMNTSLDTSNRLYLQKSRRSRSRMAISKDAMDESKDTEDRVINTVTTKDLSLTEKLKNVAIHCNTKDSSSDKNIESSESCTKENRVNNTSNNSKKSVNKTNDGRSYIEATPYPTCRSVLLRSQLKQNTVANPAFFKKNSENNANKSIECINLDNEGKTVNETILLDNSSFCKVPRSKTQPSVIINESMDESRSENDKNGEASVKASPKRKYKRKLLPLRENSQLVTFTPVETERALLKNPTFIKRRKKGKKQLLKKKLNARKNVTNASSVENTGEESSKLSLEDEHIFDEKKKTKKPRKILSKKILVKKIVNEDIFKRLDENRVNVNQSQMEASVSNRNSTNEFQSLGRLSGTQLPRRHAQKINIVATGLSNDDKSMVKSVVKTLGNAKIESSVSKRTTHVVTTGVRTINLLHGIIRGCWLVSLEWVLKSLENNGWLSPEKYEMKHFSKAVMENRKDRQLFGKAYVPELFTACGYIYVQKDTTPSSNLLKDLIKAAGGFVTEKPEIAKIRIGANGLKETWVLDCITTGELQTCNEYRLS